MCFIDYKKNIIRLAGLANGGVVSDLAFHVWRGQVDSPDFRVSLESLCDLSGSDGQEHVEVGVVFGLDLNDGGSR